MNKNAIQIFTEFAKKELTKAVIQKAFEYGVTKHSIAPLNSIINGKVLSIVEQRQRITLVNQIRKNGFDSVIEEITYTWFNRFVALRFMEVNEYLPSKVRVFSDENNNFNPQIIKEALNIELENLNRNVVIDYLDKNNTEELYKYLLITQCNALNSIIPSLFERISDYTELLFPDNLLKKNSVLEHLVLDIPEEDWKNQVQIIGWIYQFYVACDRNELKEIKTINKDSIPTLTQIFTPDWIVRYLTENSLGRLWLESNHNSGLKNEMKYFVEETSQEETVYRQLNEIKYKDVNLENIKIIEPCCGSGHILVYIFDLLYKMYEEKGYGKADISPLILGKNIYGLDIDKRAVQLAYFSLLMKARSMDSRLFSRNIRIRPNIYEIKDSKIIQEENYIQIMSEENFSKESIDIAKYLVETFDDAKVIGSLLIIEKKDYFSFVAELKEKKNLFDGKLDYQNFYFRTVSRLIELARLAIVMSNKYDVMVTNPPYLGIPKIEKKAKDYLIKHYPSSKADMFAMFMETPYVKNNGFKAIVNPDSWMFLGAFDELRKNILEKNTIINLIHLGGGAFDAAVQANAFVIRNLNIKDYKGTFFRLINDKNNISKEALFLQGEGKYIYKQSDFKKLPGYPIAFWITENLMNLFLKKSLLDYLISPSQNQTGNNDKWLRKHWELSSQKIGKKDEWLLYAKGGGYRKWWGNLIEIINWTPEARLIYQKGDEKHASQIVQQNFWYKRGITWGKICGINPSFRVMPAMATYDITGLTIFVPDELYFYILAYLNTKICFILSNVLNPTVNLQLKDVRAMPIIFKSVDEVTEIAKECIEISKKDWDSFELSWEFKKNPLV